MLCALLLAAAPSGAPRVAPIALEDLILLADAIVVGQVARVVCVGPDGEVEPAAVDAHGAARCSDARTVAEVAVERVLRGDPYGKRIWYLAESTWTCDVTDAEPGERALFFLMQSGGRLAREEQREAQAELTSGQPVLHVAWSGRGIMPLSTQDGEERITSWGTVVPPEELAVAALPDRPASSVYWTARLEDVARFAEARIAHAFRPLPAHPVSGLPACIALIGPEERTIAAWWRDGTVVWSSDLQAGGPPFLHSDAGAGRVTSFAEKCDGGFFGQRSRQASALSVGPPAPRVALRLHGMLREFDLEHEGAALVTKLRHEVLAGLAEREGQPLAQALVLR